MNNITGIVVTFNEEGRLKDCLSSLSFCSQLIVVDLGSTDNTVEIAFASNAEIIISKKVPIVEKIRSESVSHAANDWLVFIDPDEIFPSGAVKAILEIINTQVDVAVIALPWQFYFKGKALNTTIWGQKKHKRVIANKNRVEFKPLVHKGMFTLKGYREVLLPYCLDYQLSHYWIDSYTQLFEKHQRYLQFEGESLYAAGENFSWIKTCLSSIKSLLHNLIIFRGFQGGRAGIFLSFFYAYYRFMSFISLRNYVRKSNRKTVN